LICVIFGGNFNDLMDFFTIFAIALGLSFDTFAISFSYGVIRNKILFCQAVRIGKSAGSGLGNRVEIIGGLILIAIGIKIFIEHIIAS